MTNQKSLDEAEFLELIRNIDELDFLEEEDFEGEDAELYQQLQAQQTLPQNYSTKVTENTEEEWTQQNDGSLHDSSGQESWSKFALNALATLQRFPGDLGVILTFHNQDS